MSQPSIPRDLMPAIADSRSAKGRGEGGSRHVSDIIKRGLDVAASALLLLFLSPVFALVALIVRADGGPVLFGHPRVGVGGASFRCLKFRSMVVDADRRLQQHLDADPEAAAEWRERRKLARDPRITRFGAFLRATSLDELPQLLNVLRGEMSLVGPRPVVQEELDQHYGPVGTAAYLAQRPGITGLWQISGRSDTSYRQRVALDIRYAEECSLLGDLRILIATVPSVLARRGAM
jgi:lipopolysaccharide/colanic/teichoic acid biosynthesis glycosyltransferase